MTFLDYQIISRKTWLSNEYDTARSVLGLVGEAGEVAEKYKKSLRGDGAIDVDDLKKELGDCAYYLARVADNFGINLNEVLQLNIDKLNDRMVRGKLKGSGDSR